MRNNFKHVLMEYVGKMVPVLTSSIAQMDISRLEATEISVTKKLKRHKDLTILHINCYQIYVLQIR